MKLLSTFLLALLFCAITRAELTPLWSETTDSGERYGIRAGSVEADYFLRWLDIYVSGMFSDGVDPVAQSEILEFQNEIVPTMYEKCLPMAEMAQTNGFAAIAVLDENAVVTEFLIMPPLPELQCFSDEMVGKRYPKNAASEGYILVTFYSSPGEFRKERNFIHRILKEHAARISNHSLKADRPDGRRP